MPEEYLVFYETEEDGEDEIHLEAHARHHKHAFDVDADMDVSFNNEPSALGTTGLVISILSGLLGLVAMIMFILKYPGSWFDGTTPTNSSIQTTITVLAMVSSIGLLIGAFLAMLGRRVTTTAELRDVTLFDLGRE